MHGVGDVVMCLCVFNGHIGWHIDGYDVYHGGDGIGQ